MKSWVLLKNILIIYYKVSERLEPLLGETQLKWWASHYADQINVNPCLASTRRCRSAKKESHQSPAMINRRLLTENVARLQPPDATCFSAYKTNRTATNYSDEREFINQYDKRTCRCPLPAASLFRDLGVREESFRPETLQRNRSRFHGDFHMLIPAIQWSTMTNQYKSICGIAR